jgi:hypothetical protein
MEKDFKHFCHLLLSSQKELGILMVKNNSSHIQFEMPIVTLGKVMGHNYIGIINEGDHYNMYVDSKSSFKTIKGKRTNVLKDMPPIYYDEILNDLLRSQMMNSTYLKMTFGR